MEVQYRKEYSPIMGREMEMKIWGHSGRPVLFIPCQDGHHYDFENFKMLDVLAPRIESGELRVYSIDTIDLETWSNTTADPRWRAELYERWITFICNEVVPFMGQDILVFGCSLGATHAAILYYRRPDLFSGLLAISGIYSSEYGFGNYKDELTYYFSPVDFLENMPEDHPYINMYNSEKSVICTGQGAWEQPETARRLADIFARKGIHTWVDFWGYDVNHDWPWWFKMVDYFMPYLLNK